MAGQQEIDKLASRTVDISPSRSRERGENDPVEGSNKASTQISPATDYHHDPTWSHDTDLGQPPPQPLLTNGAARSNVQLPETLIESLVEALREIRLAQAASIEQQHEVVRYTKSLHEWLERDVHDRQMELRRIVDSLEGLKETRATGGEQGQFRINSEDPESCTPWDEKPEPWQKKNKRASSQASRHPVFLTPTPSHAESPTADPSPTGQFGATNAAATVTVTLGSDEDRRNPVVQVTVNTPYSQRQFVPQFVPQPQMQPQPLPPNFQPFPAPAIPDHWVPPRFQSPWPASNWNAPQIPPARNSWGMPPAPTPMQMPQSVYMQSPWYPPTGPNDIPMGIYPGTSLPIVPGMDGRFFNNQAPFLPQHISGMFMPPQPRSRSSSSERGRKSRSKRGWYHTRSRSPIEIYARSERGRRRARSNSSTDSSRSRKERNPFPTDSSIVPPRISKHSAPVNHDYTGYPGRADSEMPIIVPATHPNGYVPFDLANNYPSFPHVHSPPTPFIPPLPDGYYNHTGWGAEERQPVIPPATEMTEPQGMIQIASEKQSAENNKGPTQQGTGTPLRGQLGINESIDVNGFLKILAASVIAVIAMALSLRSGS